MKQYVENSFFDEVSTGMQGGYYLPLEVFVELNSRWPQFKAPPGRHGFHLLAEVGSETLQGILNFLAEHGRTAVWGGRSPGPAEFRLGGKNVVDAGDLALARYVDMNPKKDIASNGDFYGDDWQVWVEADSISAKVLMGNVSGGAQCVVDTALRDRMVKQDFRGVSFRPVEIRGESRRAKPLWQVFTDRVLPPHLPIMQHAEGLPYDPETGAPRPSHDFYLPTVLGWRKEDLDALDGADFVRHPTCGLVYVSRRVYEWFDQQKQVESFFPVIEE